jgi:hypothetical protein
MNIRRCGKCDNFVMNTLEFSELLLEKIGSVKLPPEFRQLHCICCDAVRIPKKFMPKDWLKS